MVERDYSNDQDKCLKPFTMLRKVYILFILLLLIYLLIPGPTSIRDFYPLPDSVKSTEEGDTIQVPNVAGYYSNNYRNFAISFYLKNYQNKAHFFLPPIRINYPPEFAFTYIKDQTQSTYLEELVYPLKSSLFINGFEPFYEAGQPKYWGSTEFIRDGQVLETKVTLRYYPSPLGVRILVWAGISWAIWLLWKVGRKVVLNA